MADATGALAAHRACSAGRQDRHPRKDGEPDVAAGGNRERTMALVDVEDESAKAGEALGREERRRDAKQLNRGDDEPVAFGMDPELPYAPIRQQAVEHLHDQECGEHNRRLADGGRSERAHVARKCKRPTKTPE
jgi:hypothetical protein